MEVALLAEGVDRNDEKTGLFENEKESPSSRRAWIEIAWTVTKDDKSYMSPSSRRAWIEIGRDLSVIVGCLGRPPRGGRG